MNTERRTSIQEQLKTPTAVVVFNPNAGDPRHGERNLRSVRKVVDTLRDKKKGLGLDLVAYHETQSASHAEDITARAVAEGAGLVVATGGDGTIDNIAKELIGSETQLVLAGGGSINVLLRSYMSIGDKPYDVVDKTLFQGEPQKIDMGVIRASDNAYYFLGNGGLGKDAEVLEEFENIKKREGKKSVAHVPLQAARAYLRERTASEPYSLAARFDNDVLTTRYEDVSVVPIINAGNYGAYFDITESDNTDGVMEGVIISSEKLKLSKTIGLAYRAYTGNHAIEGVRYKNFSNATFTETSGREIIFHHDGEPVHADSSSVEASVLPQAVTLWVPDNPK